MIAFRFLLVGTVLSAGCASTPKEKILRDMVVASSLGALAGLQKSDNQNAYATMYSGVGAALAAGIGLFVYDPDRETAKYKKESETLKKELDEAFSPKVETYLPGTLAGKIPPKYRQFINPGEWKIISVDQWVEDGENRIIHQDQVMELTPPSLKPGQNPNKQKNNPTKE